MQVTVGQTATRSLEVTSEIVEKYAEITGDYNPIHFDEEFTAGTRFGRLTAQGGIATGLIHALIAMDLPGPGSVFLRQEWSFPRPVYIGDTIVAEGKITDLHERRGIATMEFSVSNQDDRVVLKGEARVMQMTPE